MERGKGEGEEEIKRMCIESEKESLEEKDKGEDDEMKWRKEKRVQTDRDYRRQRRGGEESQQELQ